MILGSSDIRARMETASLSIEPIMDDTVRENGVDLRVGDEILRIRKNDKVVDTLDAASMENVYSRESVQDGFVLQPNERLLIKIKEKVRLPNDLVGFCNIRSTFARLGVSIPPTIIDAGFDGYLTILIIGSNVPIMIKTGTRFLHVVFSTTKSAVDKPYAGKYQNSGGAVGARKDINAGER